MLSSDFLNSEEIQKLDINHRLEGRGAIMFIFEYLVDRRNGLGSYISIPSLARSMGKNKKFLLDIINNYGLFLSPKDSDIFYSPYLRTTLGLPEHPSDEEIKECIGGWKSTKKVNESCKKNQKSSNKVATFSKKVAKITPQLADNQHAPYIEHKDKDSNREDKDKIYSSSTTTNIKDDVNADVGSSSDIIKKSFGNEEWVKSISGVTGLNLSDQTVAEACIEWFCMQCTAKGKAFDSEENARWYFCNLLQQGRKTREAFDEYYKSYRYDELVRRSDNEIGDDCYFDTVRNGRRYDINNLIIPPDAPRQTEANTTWSWIQMKYIPTEDFRGKPEKTARDRYFVEYRRKHKKTITHGTDL